MLSKHKLPSLEAGILLILLATAIVGAGFFTSGNKINGMTAAEGLKAAGNEITGIFAKDKAEAGNRITGEMVRVTGI